MDQTKVPDQSANAHSRAPGDDIYLYIISLIAAVGGFLFGYDLSIITGAVLVLKGQFALTLGQEAWALGSASVGCILGPFLGPVLSDSALGRKWTLMIAAGVFLAGTLGTALAKGMFDFNLYRILGGVGVGLASVVSPMYIAETSPARIRGRLVTLNQLAIVVGSTASIIVAYFLLESGIPWAWRWMFASACVPGLVLIIGLFFVPHSPRWLVEKNRLPEARSVLTKTDGAGNADSEMRAILASIQEEEGNIWELFGPGVRVALLITVGLAFFQQWTGVSTMTFYAPIIYQKAGFTHASVYWTDINRFLIHRFTPANQSVRTWVFDEPVTALTLTDRDQVLAVVLGSRVILWEPASDVRHKHVFLLEGWPKVRLNEGRADPRGSLWAGSMRNNVNPDGSPGQVGGKDGVLYRIDPDTRTTIHRREVGISNTLAWSPDHRRLYFGDTLANTIWAYDYDVGSGTIENERPFFRVFRAAYPMARQSMRKVTSGTADFLAGALSASHRTERLIGLLSCR